MLKASYILFLGAITVGVALAAYFTSSVERVSHLGVSGCVNCHESAASGAILSRWETGPHGGAFDALDSETSRKFVRDLPDSTNSCLPCHSTLGSRPILVGDQQLVSEGVGCEACHGPGSLYSASIIMRSPGEMRKYGGSTGNLEDCGSCHRTGQGDPVADNCPIDSSLLDAKAKWKEIGHSLSPRSRDSIVVVRNGEGD